MIGEMPAPEPGQGEVRIRISSSGVNPGDVKKRQDAFGLGMAYPRVVPHSDGAGVIEAKYPLASIADAHEVVEQRTESGRVVVTL